MKALIFDMDGVLLHSSRAHETAFRKVLRTIGVKRFDYKRVAGMKTRDSFEKILRTERIPYSKRELESWARAKQQAAYRLLLRRPPIAKGCRHLLETLSRRYRLALVSSSRRKNVNLFLAASRTRPFFSVIMGSEDLTHSKPSPLLYKTVLKRLRMKPRDIVVIEDSLQGVRSAKGAQLRVIGMRGDTSGPELKRAGAFRVIRDIRELRSL